MSALCSFYEYPDEAGEILEALTQFKLQLVDRIMEHLKPDVVMYMDDLGTQNAPLEPLLCGRNSSGRGICVYSVRSTMRARWWSTTAAARSTPF